MGKKKHKQGKRVRLARHEQLVIKAVRSMLEEHGCNREYDLIGFHLSMGASRIVASNTEQAAIGVRTGSATLLPATNPVAALAIATGLKAEARHAAEKDFPATIEKMRDDLDLSDGEMQASSAPLHGATLEEQQALGEKALMKGETH